MPELIKWCTSLIQFYPGFEEHLRESLQVLIGKEAEKKVEIGMAKDGSGVGGMYPSFFHPGLYRIILLCSRFVRSSSV